MSVYSELLEIQRRDGSLRPEAVVDFARNPQTALHARFEWDETRAAHLYRLEQARHIIRTQVRVVPGMNEPVRAFVSLRNDRGSESYRVLTEVMGNAQMRAELLAEALRELNGLRQKYRQLQELEEVWSALTRAEKRNIMVPTET